MWLRPRQLALFYTIGFIVEGHIKEYLNVISKCRTQSKSVQRTGFIPVSLIQYKSLANVSYLNDKPQLGTEAGATTSVSYNLKFKCLEDKTTEVFHKFKIMYLHN